MSAISIGHPELIPIQSLDIEADSRITFDLYVNLPLNQKFILYKRAGDTFENQRIEKLNRFNVSNFFIHRKDYHEFVKYVALRVRDLIGSDNTAHTRKLMTAAAKSMLGSTFSQEDPAVAKTLMNNLNDIAMIIIESALEGSHQYNKKTFRKLLELADKGTDFQKHPVNVSSLAVLMTFGIGYSNEKMLSDIAMAAILHDIGLSRIDPQLLEQAHSTRPVSTVSKDKISRHPELSILILEEKGVALSELTRSIILQHHEEFNGLGYPRGVRGYSLNELSQILRVCDDLDTLLEDSSLLLKGSKGLKYKVAELLDKYLHAKVIEPTLLKRIRSVLI